MLGLHIRGHEGQHAVFLNWGESSIQQRTHTLICRCSVAKSYLTLHNPMNCGTPGFPILRHLPEPAQTHVHWVSDAIQPSHPLSPSSSSALHLSQLQGLCQWVGSSHQGAKVSELQLQHQCSQWIFSVDFLWNWLAWFPCSPRDSQESSLTYPIDGTAQLICVCAYTWQATVCGVKKSQTWLSDKANTSIYTHITTRSRYGTFPSL